MKRKWRGILSAVGAGTFLILATAVSAPVQGSDPPNAFGSPAQWGQRVWAPHFGQVDTTRGHRLETVVSSRQIRVYVYDRNGNPENVESAKGTVRMIYKDGRTHEVRLSPVTGRTSPSVGVYGDIGEMGRGRHSMDHRSQEADNMAVRYAGQQYLAGDLHDRDVAIDPTSQARIKLFGLPGRQTALTFSQSFHLRRAPMRGVGGMNGLNGMSGMNGTNSGRQASPWQRHPRSHAMDVSETF